MKPIESRRTLVALFVLAVTTGPGLAHAQEEGSERATLSKSEVEALYRARQDSARMRFTEADVYFVTGMVSHHAQALVMSELAPSHDAGSSVQTLAARIINAQRDEIALMQRWLEDRGQPVPQVRIEGLNLVIDLRAPAEAGGQDAADDGQAAHDGHMRMPGMLTREQLEELDAARGPDFDRFFLTYMIQHHGGAVTMVHDLFAVDGAGQDGAVFKLASDIQADQITEIARMRGMLTAMADPAVQVERDAGP